jgi:hypothetical protein
VPSHRQQPVSMHRPCRRCRRYRRVLAGGCCHMAAVSDRTAGAAERRCGHSSAVDTWAT